jgi:hypothetical protein
VFDLRYHVASLAAVFVALVIGILVGVAISSNSSLSNPERKLLEEQKAELQAKLGVAGARAAELAQGQRAAAAFAQAGYPLVMQDRLRGKRIGLVVIGAPDPRVRGLVQAALNDANALPTLRFRALKVPLDAAAMHAALARHPTLAAVADPSQPAAVGRELGRELVTGRDTPLWNVLSGQLIVERSGGEKKPLDGVVLVRTAAAQEGATARFLRGFYAGLAATGAPLVGVQVSTASPSALPTFRRDGISSVDDLELPVGRLALVALLAGAPSGHYGLAEDDNALLPPLQALPAGG